MRLLVAIHLSKIHEARDFAKFVKRNSREDPHTFLISFRWGGFSMEKMTALIKEARLSPLNVLSVRAATGDGWATVFEPYKESFAKAIETALQNAWAREKVDVVLFGGTAKGCFNRIGEAALKELIARLGPRLGRIETAAQWTYKLGGKRVLPLPLRKRALWNKAKKIFKARKPRK